MMAEYKRTTYDHGKLIMSIVKRSYGEKLVDITKHAGARGGTIIPGRGVGKNRLLDLLGLGDSEQDIVLTLAADERVLSILDALRMYKTFGRLKTGLVAVIDVSKILKHVAPEQKSPGMLQDDKTGRPSMGTETDHVLITFIVNRGYADDAMAAARKAGAAGGTIVNARGTGKEEDVKLFGIPLVPEKEILLILVEAKKASLIREAVKQVPCLSEPGSGIVYSIEVEDFFTLGSNS